MNIVKVHVPPTIEKKTGITNDYVNEWAALIMRFNCKGRDGLAALIRKTPPRKYEERYPPSKYDDVVNDSNRQAVQVLDELAEKAATMTDATMFSDSDFKQIANQAGYLIFGEEKDRFYSDGFI